MLLPLLPLLVAAALRLIPLTALMVAAVQDYSSDPHLGSLLLPLECQTVAAAPPCSSDSLQALQQAALLAPLTGALAWLPSRLVLEAVLSAGLPTAPVPGHWRASSFVAGV